ncbi:metallophosphoesterase [Brevibacillus sp. SYSU BS000544]|uniref:metallophosphoesterase n=1 Tax=Brevibacillus sp. SYSU BS000544 TaxID=3416443 RepID=UPI003CE4B9B0
MFEKLILNWFTILKFGLLIVLLVAVYSTLIERYWVEIKQVTVNLDKFPDDQKGLRLVLFSDTHLGFFFNENDLRETVEKINQLNPDVICFTGDFLDSRDSLSLLEPASEILQILHAPLGKYAILGNHDYRSHEGKIREALQAGGFQVLINQSVTIQKENQQLAFIGLDDVLHGNPDFDQAMKSVQRESTKILLVHEPDVSERIQVSGVDLQLSGHSHAGQVRFPFVGPVLTSTLGKTYNAGLYQTGSTTVYTNRGLGTTILPVRLFARPEITVLTIQ